MNDTLQVASLVMSAVGFCMVLLLFVVVMHFEAQVKNLTKKVNTMANKLDDFITKTNAAFDAIDRHVDGLTTDVTTLKNEIDVLKNASGDLSTEQQAALDAVAARAESIGTKLAALDEVTPPPAPAPES